MPGKTIDESEYKKDEQIEKQTEERTRNGGCNQNDTRKINFPDECVVSNKAIHAGSGGLDKEIPENDTEQKEQFVMGRTLFHEHREHDVKHTKKRQWLEQGPNITQDTAVVAHLELIPSQCVKKTPNVTKFELLIHY
jgi:hypothetical protein